MSGDQACDACGQTERECLRGGGRCCNVCQHSDPAPSPSIPDPSDERGRFRLDPPDMYGRMHLYDSGTPIAHLTVGFPGMPDDSADALRVLLAARPTSLPEALEPDEWRPAKAEHVIAEVERRLRDTGWSSHAEDRCRVALMHIDAWREGRARAAATPSAPPVAVDPEARLWTDDDLLAAIGSALEVQTGMGETALLWEVYKPEGVAVALRQRLKDAGVLASTGPAVDPEAGAGETDAHPFAIGADGYCRDCATPRWDARHTRAAASGGDGEGTGNDG